MGSFARDVWESQKPAANSRVSWVMRQAGVQRSADLDRVLALPRRDLDLAKVEDLTELYRVAGGEMGLRPIQSAALWEAEEAGGLVGPIGVGWGKTLILLLLADAMRAERAVLLVPGELKRQLLEDDVPRYGKHFRLPLERIAGVVSYEELSTAVRTGGVSPWWQWSCHLASALEDALSKLRPDVVIADEAHRLRRKEAARTRRFLRYMTENPETRFAALSGSFTSRSVRDYAHLATLALRKNVPLPLNFVQLSNWADALDAPRGDAGKEPLAPGALVLLCRDDAEPVRDGFRRRLVETPGWVATDAQAFDGSLYLRDRKPRVPEDVRRALEDLRATWEIGGEEITEAMVLAKVARQLACGFFLRWKWPGGRVDQQWLDAKRAWGREVRDYLKHHSTRGMDSPKLLENAAASGRWRSETWADWAAVRKRPKPETEAVWISDYVVRDAVAWARAPRAARGAGGEGIVWASHVALAEAIAVAGCFPHYGEGTDAGTTDPTREPLIVCSTKAQSEGKNLQAWSRSLVTSASSNPTTWEQVLGRTHRPGQEEDEVWCDVEQQTEEQVAGLRAAIEAARGVQETGFGRQKLLAAVRVR